ncbi:carboxypeptidase regulatory-like domain-containing protein [Cognatilysobacter bugurensis]|uniref:Carboxypeptidase regulatory-like domain-containing protein n=1 Tax=Cognatilysobacter bugurensis TaxID=543356 RepID=A0A918SWA4_9GAMM|nr:carboxypeptidase regulatory-like domain-containing protein [Lysobacter bugurensis]GHA73807.1 hypothetical protein GCM10007067_08340 [Lysobacter bugurensis]
MAQTLDWLDTHADVVVACVLLIAALLAIARLSLAQWRAAPARRIRPWRLALLVIAQPLCAALLYLALLPPSVQGSGSTLVVATEGTTRVQWDAAPRGVRIALPEAPALPGGRRTPDLATAVRRHPEATRVHVLGAGLEARDRDAARGLSIVFEPLSLPRGVVELDAPQEVAVGGAFGVSGRVHGVPGAVVELVDPASRRTDRVPLGRDGGFTLSATARTPGAASWGLRVFDGEKRLVESVDVPVSVSTPSAPRVLMLGGAPGPELKFLRRWAEDAGVPLHTQINLGGGLQAGDPPISLSKSSLSRFDVVVLDERAWSSLGESQRDALAAAVRNGLGMLVRVTAAPSEVERRRLRALGFSVDGGRDAVDVQLAPALGDADALRARLGPGTPDAPLGREADVPEVPVLTRRTLRIRAPDGATLHAGSDGTPVAIWRGEGRGRIAVSSLVDSHRLVLGGRGDLHAELWSHALATLARAHSGTRIEISGAGPVGERMTLCRVGSDARVMAPDGKATALTIDPATGSRSCAAYFPRLGGWHRLHSREQAQLFHVRRANELAGARALERRDATLQLAARQPEQQPAGPAAGPMHAGPRWPWWLAWLLVSAAVWWFERSRIGRPA